MELQLNSKKLERIFTTARQLNIEEAGDKVLDYNGIIIEYDTRELMLQDLEKIGEYINKLNGAIFY